MIAAAPMIDLHLIEIESGTPLASVQSMCPLELSENSPL
jgi:hypothetical protein